MKTKGVQIDRRVGSIGPDLSGLGIARKIVGKMNSPGTKLLAREYWYVMDDRLNTLHIPEGNLLLPENESDTFTSIEQGRTLDEVQVDANGEFALRWKDRAAPAAFVRPWFDDVILTDEQYPRRSMSSDLIEGRQVRAYRILTIHYVEKEVIEHVNQPVRELRLPLPAPIIVFFGAESEKDVGELTKSSIIIQELVVEN